MRPLTSLTFDAFRDLLARAFKRISDKRDPRRITWEMPAVLMSAFAMFFFQHPNLLEYQRRMKKKNGRSNLSASFRWPISHPIRKCGRSLTERRLSRCGGCCLKSSNGCGERGGRRSL